MYWGVFQAGFQENEQLNYWPPDIPNTLQWRHNGRDGVSNHQPHECLLNRLFGRRSKKTSKLRVTGFCVGNSPETCESPAQMVSNAENASPWWRHHASDYLYFLQAVRVMSPSGDSSLWIISHVGCNLALLMVDSFTVALHSLNGLVFGGQRRMTPKSLTRIVPSNIDI